MNGKFGETSTDCAIMPPCFSPRRVSDPEEKRLVTGKLTIEKPSKSISFQPMCCKAEEEEVNLFERAERNQKRPPAP